MGVDLPRFLCVNAFVYGFLFFMMGRLVYEHIGTLFGAKTQCTIYIATLATDLYVCLNYDRFDMYLADTYNPIVYFVSSLLTSVSVLLVCKQTFGLIPSASHDFIKTISRGTMLIVGTHYVLLKVFVRLSPAGCNISFGLKMAITIAIVAVYFVVIRYTFSRVPVLYGKRK